MKRYLLFIALLLPLLSTAQNQSVDKKKHKVVIQLTNGDTLVHKGLVKQLRNIQRAAPNTKIEVVCHNEGISFLHSAKSKQLAAITELKNTGVDFVACENTMRDRNISRADLVAECRTVPAGMVEIINKQEKGWAYVKAGF